MATIEVKCGLMDYLEMNSIVAIDVTDEGRKVCRYMELLNNCNVSVDVLLEHYMTFDATMLTMKELSEHADSVRKSITCDGDEFLRVSVLNQAMQLRKRLKDILESPTRYMLDLIRDRELHNPIYFTVFPMSNPVVEECEAHPHEMAVAIMGGKVADALMFIPNMLEWSSKFPEMKGISSDLVKIAKEAKMLVAEELAKMPLRQSRKSIRCSLPGGTWTT